MYILDVILISTRTKVGTLSYFKEEKVSVGSIIEVPFRTKVVRALVIDVKSVSDAKSEIKGQNFALRKAKSIVAESFFSKAFVDTLKNISEFYVTDIATVFSTITLSSIFKSGSLEHKIASDKIVINQPTYIIQAPDKERGDYYRSSIREAFAKGHSVLFVVPTQGDVENWYEILRKGIEQYVIRLHGSLTEKTQKVSYNKISKDKHPVLVIGTPVILSVSRADLGMIIIEHESSPYYRSINAPYIDGRIVAKEYSRLSGIKLLLGDSLLRFETLARHESGEYTEIRPLLYRQHSTSSYLVEDMRTEDKENGFRIIGRKAREILENAREETNCRILLFTFRTGLYTSSVCRDCGNVEKCSNCSQTLMVGNDKVEGKRIMLCGRCGKKERADRLCSRCGSWDIMPLGVGTERVYEEVRQIMGEDTDILVIDKENAKTKKSLETLIQKEASLKKVVVIATEMALDHLQKKFDYVIVVSYDTLFSIPLYDANEHIAHLTMDLQEKSIDSLIVQTRNPVNEVVKGFASHNIPNLIREDVDIRKVLGYPPFKRILKIKWKGDISGYDNAAKVTSLFDEFSPHKWHKLVGARDHELVMIIKIDTKEWLSRRKDWENSLGRRLYEKLHGLGEDWSIEIDPSNVL